MKRLRFALGALAATLAIAPTAFGDVQSFSFSYSDSVAGVTATGTLVGSEIGNTGSYQITSGSITTISGYGTLSGVIGTDPADLDPWTENVLYFSSPSLLGSQNALAFLMTGGSYNAIWGGDNSANGGPPYSIWFHDDYDIAGGGTFAVSAPDGGMTIMLLGGALVGLGTLRRRFRV